MSIINTALIGKVKKTKADKTNVLELDQIDYFLPALPYHPATKEYVDNTVAAPAGTVTGTLIIHSGDGAEREFAIGSTPASIHNVTATINGLAQTPTVAFTILSSALTFAVAPLSDDVIVIRDNRAVSSTVALTTNTRYHYIFDASTTVVTGVDDNGRTLKVDENNVFVFLNGSKLIHGDDYTVASGGASITLAGAAVNGDELEIQSLGTASVLSLENIDEFEFLHSIQASFKITTLTTTQTLLCQLPISDYQSCRYTISVKAASGIHMTEIMSIHDGTNVYTNEFGEIISGIALATFETTISGGNLRLLATPASSLETIFTVHRTGMEV
jgi:hypothetical protein